MSVLEREIKILTDGRNVIDALRTGAVLDHWIVDGSSPGTLLIREPFDLGTYYPVEVSITLGDCPEGHTLLVRATSEGHDLYYENHLKVLVERLVSRLGPLKDDGMAVATGRPEGPSDLDMLENLFRKGLLSEREYEMAKRRVVL
jgi:hypothetical protein